MLGLKREVIAQNERGLQFRDGILETVLQPGVYRYFDGMNRIKIERFDLTEPEFAHALVDWLLRERSDLVDAHFQRVELGEREVGLVFKDRRLAGLLRPGERQLYWQDSQAVRVQTVDIGADYRVAAEIAVLLRQPRTSELYRTVQQQVLLCDVADNQLGLLLVDGSLVETLGPGSYAFWKFQRTLAVEIVDRRLQPLDVAGQEILTKDKVSLRLNLSAAYRVTDPVKARADLANAKDYLYRELQFGLRQSVATRSLDELLGNKGQLDREVFDYVAGKAAAHGIELGTVGIKDVILPGDMKDILNQVVEAEKVAQANVIKRREETAATRSLLNTARLMEDSPTLMRLKELEMLEKVTGRVDKLTVYGGLEGLLTDLVTIKRNETA